MTAASDSAVSKIFKAHGTDLLDEWVREQIAGLRSTSRIREGELRNQSAEFLNLLQEATQSGNFTDINAPHFSRIRDMLGDISRSRGIQGFTPTETAMFVFSLKRPLFARIRQDFANDVDVLSATTWAATELIDRLGLYTTEMHQKSREEIIARQQEEMLELSTPVVKLWDGILALPMIGTLDSARTQVVMESLLQRIVETGADVAIIELV